MSAKSFKNRSGLSYYPFNLSSPAGLTVMISIIIVFLLSFLDLAGWIFNIPLFKSVLSIWTPMRIITAVCFILAASVVLVLQVVRPVKRKSKILMSVFALFISFVGIITIFEYILILKTNNDSALMGIELFSLFLAEPNRMALITAINFSLIGFVLLFLIEGRESSGNIAHFIILPGALLSYFVPVSYILGVYSIHDIAEIPVALNTGVAFCGLCISIFFLKPESWLMKSFTSRKTGGIVARKLLPSLMMLPVVIGWLRIQGERSKVFESDEGVTFVALTYTVCFLVLVWLTSRSISAIDKKRLDSEAAMRISHDDLLKSEWRYRLLVDSIPDTSIHLFDREKCFLIAGGPEIVKNGLDKSQIEGKTLREAYPPEVTEILDPFYDKALKGESSTFEHSFGEYYYLQQVIPLLDNNGQVNAGMVISTNITERKKAANKQKESEEKYKLLFDSMIEGFALHEVILDENGIPCDYRFLSINPAFEKQTGLIAENLIGKKVTEALPGTEKYWIDTYGKVAMTGASIEFENYHSELNRYFRVSAFSPKKGYFATIFEDITLRVLSDKELRSTKNHLEKLINYANAPIIVWNRETEITLFNHAFENLTGYSADEVVGQRLDFLFPKKTLKESKAWIKSTLKENLITVELPILTKEGNIRTVLWNSANIYDKDENTVLSTVAQGNDITERREAEEQAKLSREKLNLALENAGVGVWEWDIPSDILIVDERLSRMFGLDDNEKFTGSFASFDNFIFEEDLSHFRAAISKTLNDNIPFDTVIRIKTLTKDFGYINTRALTERDVNGKPLKMTGVCFDITGMKKGAEQALFNLNENLTRSNKELEQFAYVASHDLQEPLRMVSSFTQLLSMRYKDKLDENANEFISYAVDGAHRMQNLINDLLEYSRINTTGKPRTRVDMHELLGQAIKNLRLQISEKNALVTNDELPVIIADGSQIVQLLQNLIANALKFCERPPLVHISAREEKDFYIFSVKDNGIGIEVTYFEKIFQIFQRLHLKEEYHGTGIGLSICRRIAERHGGKIWVESSSKHGTTFSFSIQKNPVYN